MEKLDEESTTASLTGIGPFWFHTQERFRFYDEEGQVAIHPFFDFAPFEGKNSEFVNVYPLTLEKSSFRYEFELGSGRPYKVFNYCEQNDIWAKYEGKVYLPPFTEGIIPRFLDEQGKPQKVIVFGHAEDSKEGGEEASLFSKVRIVGGTYEQFCRQYPCLDQERWTTRLLLIAVDSRDERFSKVTQLEELKSLVDWPYVKAFLQNAQGRSSYASGEFPAYRILGELDQKKALELSKSRGRLLEKTELQSIRKRCEVLYDSIYEASQQVRESLKKHDIFNNREAKDPKFLFWSEQTFIGEDYVKNLSLIPTISKRNVWKYGDELLEELKKEQDKIRKKREEEIRVSEKKKIIPKNDAVAFVKVLFEKYYGPYSVCERYVRPSSINHETQRHWFFVHLSAFQHVVDLGYYYNCGKRAWFENPVNADGRFEFSPYKEFLKCGNFDIDDAFSQAVKVLVMKAKNNQEHYAYLEYDNAQGGSHRKIHNWVYFSGKELSCLKNGKKIPLSPIDYDRFLFPEDVSWMPFVPPHQTEKTK